MQAGSTHHRALVHDVDYVLEEDLPVVRVFGRGDRNSLCILFRDFRPYFYCMPEGGGSARELMKRLLKQDISVPAHVMDARIETRTWLGHDLELVRVTVDSPRNVRESRHLLSQIPAVKDTYEKDILFKRRFIIDRGINPMGAIACDGRPVTSSWPVGALVDDGTITDIPEDSYAEISHLKVLAFDIEVATSGVPDPHLDPIIMIGLGDSSGTRILTYGRNGEGMESCRDEREMIARFASIVTEGDYDILVGYNSDSFDLPYLRTRSRHMGDRLRIGRDLSEVSYQPGGMMGRSIVRGRMNIDLYPPSRRMMTLPSYTLAGVYQHLSGREKLELSSEEVNRLWQTGSDQDAARIAEYCTSDVEATLLISGEILPTLLELSKRTKQLLTDVARMGQSQMVEWLLIREAFRQNELVPNKPTSAEASRRKRETYEGGYVLEPRRGLHTDLVALDFRSLYPTIIVTHNVDMSTLDCKCCPEGHASPTGHHFCRERVGFIPSILGSLVRRRMEIKDEMRDMDASSPSFKKMDAMQNALKILSNSFYGYSGYPQARWYSRECAESIAGWGREYVKETIASAEREGFQVIYSDTDSIFITRHETSASELIDRAKGFLASVNAFLPGMIELEYQDHYTRGFFVTKKRYALIDDQGRITTRGLEVVRRDWSPIAKETQRRVLESILVEGDPSKAADEVRESVRRVSERDVRLEELVISTRMTRNLESYEAEAPHVALAKRLRDTGQEVSQGTSIDYIVRKGSGRIGDRAQPVSESSISDYDADYYVRNQVLPPSMRILSVFGFREEDLRYYKTKQRSLGDFLSPGEGGR